MWKLSKTPRQGAAVRSRHTACKLGIQGTQVVKTQAHFPPMFCASSSAEKCAFHNMPQTCRQELPGKQKGGILNFSDTLMNKVILLTDREKCSPYQAKQELLRSKYKLCNWPWQARRAQSRTWAAVATDVITARTVLGGHLADILSQKIQAFVLESRANRTP